MDASTIGGRRASGARNGRAARTRGADPPPFLSPPSPQLDVDLLCRLLWLSSWPAPGTPEAPCWTQAHPSLTALDLSSAAWTPTPAHPAPNLRRVLQACPGLVELRATGLRRGGGGGKGDRPSLALRFDAGDALLLAAEAATHPSIRTIAIDVGARLGDGDARPLAALLGGATRVRALCIRVRRSQILRLRSSPPQQLFRRAAQREYSAIAPNHPPFFFLFQGPKSHPPAQQAV
jgi:hypothetical protein